MTVNLAVIHPHARHSCLLIDCVRFVADPSAQYGPSFSYCILTSYFILRSMILTGRLQHYDDHSKPAICAATTQLSARIGANIAYKLRDGPICLQTVETNILNAHME